VVGRGGDSRVRQYVEVESSEGLIKKVKRYPEMAGINNNVAAGVARASFQRGTMEEVEARLADAEAAGVLAVKKLAVHLGAEVSGIDVAASLGSREVRAIRDALLRHRVIFFRDANLDHAQQVAFARSLGSPTIGHSVFGFEDGHPEVYSIAKFRLALPAVRTATTATDHSAPSATALKPWSGYHTDVTAAVNPPWCSVLRATDVPEDTGVGDTCWVSLQAAYEGLPPELKHSVGTLRGIHRYAGSNAGDSAYARAQAVRTMVSNHPLVIRHPETSEPMLFASPSFLKSIIGLSARENTVLLETLWHHLVRPEYSVRFSWRNGDLAVWDNRSTAHVAPTDIYATEFNRQLYRVTLLGEPLVAYSNGEPSVLLEGEPLMTVEDELAAMSRWKPSTGSPKL
jgi:taurine dioxygenase